jgi:predicted flap endonuclease-1-like 5' DNA nuclease
MTLLDTIKSVLGLDDGRSNDRRGERSEATAPATESEDAVKGTENDESAAAGGDAAGSTESMLDESAEGGAEQGEITGPAAGDDAGTDYDTEDETRADESAATGGDAAGSTGSMTEEDSSEGAAEPGEAVGPGSDEDLDPDHDEHGGGDTTSETSDDVAGGDGTAADAAAAGGDAAGSTGSMTEETNESISATEDAEATGPTDADPSGNTADHNVSALKGIGPSYAERLGEAGIETIDDLADADPAELAEGIGVAESRVERWSERAKARRQ